MGFLIHSVDDGHVPAFEYLPAGAIQTEIGLALVQDGGNLIVASGANAPAYICMCEKDSKCTAGDIIPVIRVEKGIVFETTVSAAATSLKLGNKVTLSTDGKSVTATTTDGVAELVYIGGTAAGSVVRVRF